MAHPNDSEAWKHLDRSFPDFAYEPRKVRLGMCTDGFDPNGKFGGQYSCWPVILTPYNLPPSMCMKKNLCDQLIHKVMDVKKHTSNTVASRYDIAKYCKRRQLHVTEDARGKDTLPKSPFSLDKAQKKVLCEWVRNLKFPNGYASNLSRCVDLQSYKLHGLKSHDCHVFMERLLPVALKEMLPVHVLKAITEISLFFRDLCCSTIKLSDMESLEHNIAEILCKLEKIFPPAFLNSMEHLPVHLSYKATLCGPVQYRWMYPFESFLNHLKRKIGNKARVEGSICNAYLTEEIGFFFSNYFQQGVDTKTRDLGRNVHDDVKSTLDDSVPELFRVDHGHASTGGVCRFLDEKELRRAHLYVFGNSGILEPYKRLSWLVVVVGSWDMPPRENCFRR
ncbi:uncharacterized protein LOC110686964 isoform X2 [Chenopodium quinoa]|uniref:uncharacterized protein LOC110686964 isoform X2 n=1 Tax=Chenopodium quinoa TaxID=63459 RepID=UPI000B7758CE|nr:uncharacterized protein LOC110686964 isoform X2 [Chenopodium quinoa]